MIVEQKSDAIGPDAELLVPGRRYTVYAILLSSTNQFLVYEKEAFSFPVFVSSEAIEFVDTRISGHFYYSPFLSSTDRYSSRAPLVAFQEMVSDRLFYQKLVDGDEDANRVWQRVKRTLDAEAEPA